MREFRQTAGGLEVVSPGVWRCEVLRRTVFLVSGRNLPVEEDTLPMHIIGKESIATERAVAEFVAQHDELRQEYGGWLATLHPTTWKEIEAMATTKRKGFGVDVQALIDLVGLERVLEAAGIENVIEQVGMKRVVNEIGVKRVVDEIGLKRVVDEIGVKRVVDEIGPEALVAQLTPAQRRKIKELLK